MRTDVEIKRDGYQAILEKLDIVEAQRFIALISRDKFDYTKWRESLFEGLSAEDISRKAMEFRQKQG